MNPSPASRPVFRSYSRYLKERYGVSTYRISVDAGFSCPNREGGRASPGCSFCETTGSRAPYLGSMDKLGEQIRASAAFLAKRYGAERFLLYFQAYSGTNAPPDVLRRVYDAGLASGSFAGLIVSTRPDCIDEEKADLLASYRMEGFEVWVELGLQSASDETLRRINRGHTVDDFLRAYDLLRRRGIFTAIHVILGLPGEGLEDVLLTGAFLAGLRPDGIKIHNLHVPFGTPLYNELLAGELPVLSARLHREYVIRVLEMLPPETIVMRLTCDTPRSRLAAPKRFPDKASFYASVEKEMRARGTYQGRLFTERR